MMIAAAELTMIGFTNAQSSNINSGGIAANIKTNRRTFDTVTLVDAGVLSVGDAEAGDVNGPPVIFPRFYK